MAVTGWVKLHRCIWECELWVQETPFDERSAWIDLILCCTRTERSVLFGKRDIALVPGEYVTSEGRLASRWHWSRHKVSDYLKMLKKLGQIATRKEGIWTVITVLKYSQYQGIVPAENQVKDGFGTASGRVEDELRTSCGRVKDGFGTTKQEYKEYREVNNINNINNNNTAAAASSKLDSSSFSPILEAQNTLGILSFSEYQARLFLDLFKEVGETIYIKALQKAAKAGVRSFNYVEKVAKGLLAGDDYDEKQQANPYDIDWSKV